MDSRVALIAVISGISLGSCIYNRARITSAQAPDGAWTIVVERQTMLFDQKLVVDLVGRATTRNLFTTRYSELPVPAFAETVWSADSKRAAAYINLGYGPPIVLAYDLLTKTLLEPIPPELKTSLSEAIILRYGLQGTAAADPFAWAESDTGRARFRSRMLGQM